MHYTEEELLEKLEEVISNPIYRSFQFPAASNDQNLSAITTCFFLEKTRRKWQTLSYIADSQNVVSMSGVSFPFRRNTERASQIMRDKPMNAVQTAAFWIDHVLKFGGEHLKPTTVNLTWWQLYCLDTLGFIFLILIVFLYVLFRLLKFLVKSLLKLIRPQKHRKEE